MTQLCLALDSPSNTLALADATDDFVDIFKVGLTLYSAAGPDIVEELVRRRPVFLDLKLHDIPAQVAGAASVAGGLGVSYISVHASGGADMVSAAVEAAPAGVNVLAVTVLTSLDDDALQATGVDDGTEKQVLRLAELALGCGVRGLVCSPAEVASLRARFGPTSENGPLLLVPGIRSSGEDAHDQRRTLGPRAAADAGADIIVVGRPITEASDPRAAADEIQNALR